MPPGRSPDDGPPDDARAADETRLAAYADALVEAVDAAVAGWVAREVARVHAAWSGTVPAGVAAAARAAGEEVRAAVGPELRALLGADIADQRANPLEVLRRHVGPATRVLRDAGVPPIVRDEFAERVAPDDVYGLGPATWSDVDESLHEPGLAWGAAKAHVHLARRRLGG